MQQSIEYRRELRGHIISHLRWLSGEDDKGRADFCYGDMRGIELPGIRLSKALFVGCDLRSVDFSGADLRGAEFYCADLEGANLENADLRGADLRGVLLNDARLVGANLSGADLSSRSVGKDHPYASVSRYDRKSGEHRNDTEMVDADLSQATVSSAQFVGCDMTGVVLDGANLSGADFSDAVLYGVSLEGADFGREEEPPQFANCLIDDEIMAVLEEMRIDVRARTPDRMPLDILAQKVTAHEEWLASSGKSGRRLSLDMCSLNEANLANRDLRMASFRRCDFANADFDHAQLCLTNFAYCNLTSTSFVGANVSGADFRKVSCDGANFTDAVMKRVSSGEGEDRPTNMTKIKAGRAIFKVADVDQAILFGADLRRALMSLKFLAGSNREGALMPEKVEKRAAQVARGLPSAAVAASVVEKSQQDSERRWA